MPPDAKTKVAKKKATQKDVQDAVKALQGATLNLIKGTNAAVGSGVAPRPSQAKDTKSASDRERAKTPKAKAQQKRAAEQIYKSQPVAKRKKLVKATKGKKDTTSKAIQQTHEERTTTRAKQQKAARDAYAIVDRFIKNTRPALKEEKKGGSLLATVGSELATVALPGPLAAARTVERLVPDGGLTDKVAKGAKLPETVATNIVKATIEDPRTAPKTAKGAAEMVVGAPAGVIAAISDPDEAWKQTKADYARRYGPLLEGDEKKFRERLKEEGAASELLDLTAAGTGGGTTAGRAAGSLAKRGKLGAKAKATATKERPARQISGAQTKPQEKSKNLLVAAAQDASDRKRLKKQARKVERAKDGGKKVSALVETAHEAGTIARPGVTNYATKKAVASRKAVRRIQQRVEQQREINAGTRKNLASLSKFEQQAFKYAVQLGLRADPEGAVRQLQKRAEDIRAARDPKDPTRLPDGRKIPEEQDELPKLEALIANADQAFTEKLAKVVEEENQRSKTLVAKDPGVDADDARLRRVTQQAEHLGITRGGTPVDEAIEAAKGQVSEAKKLRRKAGKMSRTAERQGGRQEGKATILGAQAERSLANKIDAEKAKLPRDPDVRVEREIRELDSENGPRFEVYRDGELEATFKDRADAEAVVERPRRLTKGERQHVIDEMTDGQGSPEDPKSPARTMAAAEKREASVLELAVREKKAKKSVKRAKKQLRQAKAAKNNGARRLDEEPLDDFVARVMARAEAEGLAEPGYHPSTKRPQGIFSAHAIGGMKATERPKEYTGELFRTGRESNDPEVYATGSARNIKRRYQWTLVADQFDSNIYAWSRSEKGDGGKPISELMDEMERRNIDPETVAFWNPGVYGRSYSRVRKENPDAEGEDVTARELEDSLIHSAAESATATPGNLASKPEDVVRSNGWVAIPKAAYDEIMAEARPSGKAGRVFDITKGKSSRYLLGNPTWLQLQLASNAFLTGLSGTGPVSVARAQTWWKKLTPEQREAVEPYLGVTPHFDDQVRLGSTTDNSMVNAYRALKDTPLWQAGRKANPLDLIFRADNAQNNVFRRAVFYKQLNKDARGIVREQDGLMKALFDSGSVQDRMLALADNAQAIERHAEYVNRFLGNYSRYTAAERRVISRFVMFYGFLRFSLRFTLYTLPAKHPIIMSIMGQLGAMHADEMERLFGGDVPPWELGNLYNGDGSKRFQASRINPFLNATQYVDLSSSDVKAGAFAGFLPPIAQAGFNQLATKNIVFGQDWKIDGSTQTVKDGEVSTANRLQILIADAFLNPNSIYRSVSKITGTGEKEGADSLGVLKRSVIQYKRDDKVEAQKLKKKKAAETPVEAKILDALTPFRLEDGRDRIKSAKEYAASRDDKPAESKPKTLKKVSIKKTKIKPVRIISP